MGGGIWPTWSDCLALAVSLLGKRKPHKDLNKRGLRYLLNLWEVEFGLFGQIALRLLLAYSVYGSPLKRSGPVLAAGCPRMGFY